MTSWNLILASESWRVNMQPERLSGVVTVLFTSIFVCLYSDIHFIQSAVAFFSTTSKKEAHTALHFRAATYLTLNEATRGFIDTFVTS